MLMLMFLLLRLSLFLFVFFSSIETIPSVSFFYPKTIDELSCSNGFSWTKWFNSAHPINDQDFDRELVSVILQTSGKDMCQLPQSIQAQSVSPLTDGQQYSAAWKVSDGTIAGFMSRTPGIDFRVRFCCSNNAFIPTTTPLPRPITNPTCGRPEIQPSIKTSRIFGGQTAIPHSWPWVSVKIFLSSWILIAEMFFFSVYDFSKFYTKKKNFVRKIVVVLIRVVGRSSIDIMFLLLLIVLKEKIYRK